jgi:CrcB protein
MCVLAVPDASGSLVGQLAGVFFGGGVGACARFLLAGSLDARLAERLPALPYVGTLVVNMVGSLLIGVAATMMPPGAARATIVAGVLGGFTTYSSFALFSVELVRAGRPGAAALQIGLHLVLGMACALAGLWLGRLLQGGASAS